MNLAKALRADRRMRLALVGAGGKTSTLFQLARQFDGPVLVSASTHLSLDQITLGDHYIRVEEGSPLPADWFRPAGVTLLTGREIPEQERVAGLGTDALTDLWQAADRKEIPLLLEADGARCMPLKAPASHEPAIPEWANTVVVVVGLSSLGQPLDGEHVHRAELFSKLSGLSLGEAVTPEAVTEVLRHPEGGLRNIPPGARRYVLFNQADTPDQAAVATRTAKDLVAEYDGVLIGAIGRRDPEDAILRIVTRGAGVILAGGSSERYGQPKQLLDFHGTPFIRKVAENALAAGCDPVLVVVGAVVDPIRIALEGLPVQLVENSEWRAGQSTSLRAGVRALPERVGNAVFFLSDQPQISPELIHRLVDRHQRTLAPVVAPFVGEQRANPVLFDRAVLTDLLTVQGDRGGRAILSSYPVERVDWPDKRILLDVDTPEDYRRLIEQTGPE